MNLKLLTLKTSAYFEVEWSPRFCLFSMAAETIGQGKNFSLLVTCLSFMLISISGSVKARESVDSAPCFPGFCSSVYTQKIIQLSQNSFVGCFMKVDQKFSSVHTLLISSILGPSSKMQEAPVPSRKAG